MEIVAALAIAGLIVQQILHARERAILLDRIQFPQQIVTKRSPEPSDEPLFLPLEDDEAVEDYQRELGQVR